MKDFLKLGGTLLIVTFLAGYILSFAYKTTKPQIAKIKKIEEEAAVKEVMPIAAKFEEKRMKAKNSAVDPKYWVAYDKDGNVIGYVAKVYGPGYSSVVQTVVGFKPDRTITGAKVVYQAETPGLGARSQEVVEKNGKKVVWFTEQYKNKKAGSIEVVKRDVKPNENAIEAISAATISSRAITNSINKGINALYKELNIPETKNESGKGDKK